MAEQHNELWDMKIGDVIQPPAGARIQRCPGGWVYTMQGHNSITAVFVPMVVCLKEVLDLEPHDGRGPG